MNQKEYAEEKLNIYAGILFNNKEFSEGNTEELSYQFDSPEFDELKDKYELEKIAGKGSDFSKAKRLLHYFATRLTHSSWYDNHVECNALKLLEYSLNNPNQGINCLNKSKILAECCLAIGIYARRVFIMPYSPYDFDNHVVTEIFDRELNKWIMLDCTTDGYFIDENRTPLSLLEIREKFANDEFVTFITSTARIRHLKALRAKNVETSAYICKNLFYFMVDQVSTFGVKSNVLLFVPSGYSIKSKDVANAQFRINHLSDEHVNLKESLEKFLKEKVDAKEPESTNIQSFARRPD